MKCCLSHFGSPIFQLTNIFRFEIKQLWRNHHLHSLPLLDSNTNNNKYSYGILLHASLLKSGRLQSLFFANRLLNFYVQSQNLSLAHQLFDEITNRDVRTWTIIISGFARIGSHAAVLHLVQTMQQQGVSPNHFTLSNLLKCCSTLLMLSSGKQIHAWLLRYGVSFDSALENSMLDLYVKCGASAYARSFFNSMAHRDIVSWNIMLAGYMNLGEVEQSLELFQALQYKDVSTWNTVIDGLLRSGCEKGALDLLYSMILDGPSLSHFSFSIAFNLVSRLRLLELGKQIHARILRLLIHDSAFIRNSLLDMYCKCGKMKEASKIFEKMPIQASSSDSMAEIVSWSSLVSGFVRNGEYEHALQIFSSMVTEHVIVDKFTLTSILTVCADTGLLDLGKQIHAYIQKVGHGIDIHMASSLIDMYAKCGSLGDAQLIFKETSDSNVVLWSSMIFGCALHGQGKEAILLFENMMDLGISPNEITFLGVLSACCHGGMVEEGRKYFGMMQKLSGIRPGVEHYASMVDLYGRAGRLHEIIEFISENNISHLAPVWKSFLSSCKLHRNVELGKWVFEQLVQLEPCDAGSYVMLSNMLVADHSWGKAAELRSSMQQREVKKLPGQSWIQLQNQVHTFVMGDRSHPHVAEIYSYLEKHIARLKEIGYSPDLKSIMQDVEEEQGEVLVGSHSEKLAIVYGIISTSSGIPIRVMKNLRVCIDCHNFAKYTSQLLDREVILRDIRRFHHFKHGYCSCGDYW